MDRIRRTIAGRAVARRLRPPGSLFGSSGRLAVRGHHIAVVRSGNRRVVDSLGRYRACPDAAAADGREVRRWCGRILRRRNGGREQGDLSVSMDATDNHLGSVGTGVFGRWRQDVGNELDHDVHTTTQTGSRHEREPFDSLTVGLAGPTRFELATSGVTGRRSNQLNYDPARVLTRTRRTTEDGRRKTQNKNRLISSRPPSPLPSSFFRRPSSGLGRYRIRTCDSRRVKPVLYH